jgi:hypothetical protein
MVPKRRDRDNFAALELRFLLDGFTRNTQRQPALHWWLGRCPPPEKHINMESAMRTLLTSTALGVVLVAGISAAQAQTVFTAQPEVVQTTTTVRTVRPAPHMARHEVVTTRTVTRQVVPSASVIAQQPLPPQPLYDQVAPAPLAADASYQPRLYDSAVLPVAGPGPGWDGATGATSPYIYRYIYEPDRILVIDPNTNITVQALPR